MFGLGAFLAGAFLVLSVHAYYLLKNRHVEISKKAFKITLFIAAFFSLFQLFSGHRSAEVVAHHQPAKLAAMEGHFDSLAVADMYIMGWVDMDDRSVTGISIPKGLSFLLYQDFETPVTGLDAFPKDEQPEAINAIFQFYHFMVAIGMALILLTILGLFFLFKKKLFEQRWLLWVFVFAVILPQLANQFGWYAAEMGRQPWVVYGLLRTSDALSAAVTANQVMFSLIMFAIVYTLLLGLFIYLLTKKIKHGIDDHENILKRPFQESAISK